MFRPDVPVCGVLAMARTETRNHERARPITDTTVAAYEEGDIAGLKQHLADDFVCRPGGGAEIDTEAYPARIEAPREAFPDFRKRVVSFVVDGDEAAVRYRWSGTHEVEFAGVPATGKTVETTSLTLLKLDGDELAERYVYGDSADLMNQLSD